MVANAAQAAAAVEAVVADLAVAVVVTLAKKEAVVSVAKPLSGF